MRAALEKVMRTYGQAITLISRESGKETRFAAFLQPVLKEREDLPAAATPLGAVSRQRWLYIGPAAREVLPGDRIHFDGIRLAVQETETVYLRSEALYKRAVLRQEKEAAG